MLDDTGGYFQSFTPYGCKRDYDVLIVVHPLIVK